MRVFDRKISIKPNAEQSDAIQAQGNIIISAGAGSGKTRVLVERCLDLVWKRKTSLDRILMLTFTNDAAAEMRQRIQDALDEELTAAKFAKERDSEKILFLENEMANLFVAPICTIHSFCNNLILRNKLHLKDYPVGFFRIDNIVQKRLARKAFAKVMSVHYRLDNEIKSKLEHLEDKTENYDQVVDLLTHIYRGNADRLFDQLWKFFTFSQNLANSENWLKKQRENLSQPFPNHWVTKENIDFFCFVQETKDKVPEIASDLKWLRQNPDLPHLKDFIDQCNSLISSYVPRKKGSITKKTKEALESIVSPFKNIRDDWDNTRRRCLALLDLAEEFKKEFNREKRANGGLTFDDMLHRALDLLKDPQTGKLTDIARDQQNQFDYIFVDEYQDTDGIQDEIISCIARKASQNIEPNRFLVGDVKQSIYRFRLADPSIFVGYEELGSKGEGWRKISLQNNYRSKRDILEFVNFLFKNLMHKEIGNVQFGNDSRLIAGKSEENAPKNPFAAVSFLSYYKKENKNSEDDSKESDEESSDNIEFEARLIAREILKMRKAHFQISDKNGHKELQWKDICILCRGKITDKASRLIKVFEEAGIPIDAPGKRLVDCPEIKPLIALLNVLDNPNQDIYLWGLMDSILGGFEMQDFLDIRKVAIELYKTIPTKNLWKVIQRTDLFEGPLKDKLENIVHSIKEWRSYLRIHNTPDLIKSILLKTHYEDRLQEAGAGEEVAYNVYYFLKIASDFDPKGICMLQDFLEFIRDIQEDNDDDTYTGFKSSAGEDSVKLLTIHRSKGLEFPVVFLMSAGSQLNILKHDNFLFDKDLGLQTKTLTQQNGYWNSSHNFGSRLVKDKLEMDERGELIRLLYVALTRASERVIICGKTAVSGLLKEESVQEPMKVLAGKGNFMAWIENCILRETPGTLEKLVKQTEPAETTFEVRYATDSDPVTCSYFFQPFDCKPEYELPEKKATAKKKTFVRPQLIQNYPFEEVTTIPKRHQVTGLEQITIEYQDAQTRRMNEVKWSAYSHDLEKRRRQLRERAEKRKKMQEIQETSIALGNAHHIFLEWFTVTPDFAEELPPKEFFEDFADKLLAKKYYEEKERNAINISWLQRFYSQPEIKDFLRNWHHCHREFRFGMVMNPTLLKKAGLHPIFNDPAEFVSVQGTVDLCMIGENEIWVLDYKTNRGKTSEELIEKYTPQLRLYKVALETIFSKPVTRCYLSLLESGQIIDIINQKTE